MKSRFQQIFNLVMEDINSQRKPIQKVDAMPPKDFLKFLKEFLPYAKNGKVDLNDVRISEKVDGQSIKLLTQNGEMMFESSYSGVTTWDKVPMKEAAEFLYRNYSQLFQDIYELIGSDFKLIGELIWINEMEETGKVTPVGASYLTSKFGKHGGMVVFDIMKIENDSLVPFEGDKEDEIFNMIRDLNNEDFSFYLIESIDITKNVTFTLDVDKIEALISNPEFNKDRFDKRKDAKILEEIEKIKQDVCAQLSQIVDNTKGAFSEEGDLIEGIVVRINSTGNQYGMFSNKYRDTKHVYWNTFNQIEPIFNEFFKNVFGCLPISKKRQLLPKLDQDPLQFKAAYEEHQPEYQQKIEAAYDALVKDDTIPKAAKRVQLSMGKNFVNKLSVPSYEEFIKKFVRYEE